MSLIVRTLLTLAALLGVAVPAQAGVVPTSHPVVRVVVRPVVVRVQPRYVTRRVVVRVPYTYRAVAFRTTVKRYRRGAVVTTVTRRTPYYVFKRGYSTKVRYVQVALRR